MKISVVGTGAIGSYYGIMLENAGHEVHFLLRSDYDHVKEHGLRLHSEKHDSIYLPSVRAYKNAADMPVSEVILVALKTTQNKGTLPEIRRQISDPSSIIILKQNGLDMESDLAAMLPDLQMAGGVALITSYKTEPGLVNHQDHGNLDLGSYNLNDASVLTKIVEMFQKAGVKSSQQDLNYLRWKKLVWNMSFNGLSVYLNKTTSEILEDEHALAECRNIMKEVIAGAGVCGVQLPEYFDDDMVAFTSKMQSYSPSMKLDFDFNRPMELEYLYEKPIKKADQGGFSMKMTKLLYQQLKEIDKKNTDQKL